VLVLLLPVRVPFLLISGTGAKPDFSAFLVAGKTSRTPTPAFLSDEIHY